MEKTEKKTTLLASFIDRRTIGKSLRLIEKNYNVFNNMVFVLNNKNNRRQLILTYNIEKSDKKIDYKSIIPNTITIHRNKDTNTLYTIDALNYLLRNICINGHSINWEEFKDCMLLTQKKENSVDKNDENLVIINTSLNNQINLKNIYKKNEKPSKNGD
jgi:hypothetical protein